jgi:transposase
LRSHYLFESRFCNVARGNEKGHVENLVKRVQRTFMMRISVKITTRFGFYLPLVGAQRRWRFEASVNGNFASS